MTTDEATKKEGEVQTATLAEHGEDITPNKDRGVLKVGLHKWLLRLRASRPSPVINLETPKAWITETQRVWTSKTNITLKGKKISPTQVIATSLLQSCEDSVSISPLWSSPGTPRLPVWGWMIQFHLCIPPSLAKLPFNMLNRAGIRIELFRAWKVMSCWVV